MAEIPANLEPIAYLRKIDIAEFDIVGFLQYFHLEDCATATEAFKDVIKTILDFKEKSKKKKTNKKLVKFAKAMKTNKYAILNSPEATIHFIQCAQQRASLNREMGFMKSAVEVTEAIANTRKRPLKLKIVCKENQDLKKRKFEEEDGVQIQGLAESLGTRIGKDARLLNTVNSKKEIYFKMCGMNGIIDLSDVKPGSQLYNLPKVSKDQVLKDLNEDMYVIKNIMGIKDFTCIVEKAAEPGVVAYDCLQELDELRCSQDLYGSKAVHHLILYNIISPLQVEKFSEADFVINIWAPLLKHTFFNTCLWPHWGDTVPIHLKNNKSIYIKFDFRLLGKTLGMHDWATGDAGIHNVDWKYFTDKTKLVLTTKSQLNEFLKTYCINHQSVSRIKIPFIQILGLNAVICYMQLHKNGLYKIVQVISFAYPTTKNCVSSGGLQTLLKGLSAFQGLSLNLFEFINDVERSLKLSGKKKMDRSTAESSNVDNANDNVSSWVRELWFPPNFGAD